MESVNATCIKSDNLAPSISLATCAPLVPPPVRRGIPGPPPSPTMPPYHRPPLILSLYNLESHLEACNTNTALPGLILITHRAMLTLSALYSHKNENKRENDAEALYKERSSGCT